MRVEAVEESDLALAEYVYYLADQGLFTRLLHRIQRPGLLLLLLPFSTLDFLAHLGHLVVELLGLLQLAALVVVLLAEMLDYRLQGLLEIEELNQVDPRVDCALVAWIPGMQPLRAFNRVDRQYVKVVL